MQEGIAEGRDAVTQRLRPLVVIVVTAKLAVSVLLLTTVQFSSPAALPEMARLR